MRINNQDSGTTFGSIGVNHGVSEFSQSQAEQQNKAEREAMSDCTESNSPASNKPFLGRYYSVSRM
ncbi:hypothetical protein [Lacimicrobium alkaliphilum]|uniref:Uncharacterized protein n=1 Tax=Lacimicrobium alkaliphilum TaxID=1526571 RepID=A0ABQ1QZU1_9ALTE|nr:hypothetical protein [Lacimicrobium alkaliphilum]GGD51236.1 hypothetical protein GCM10011357_03950 [Lacimicrobium alkaliphilum]